MGRATGFEAASSDTITIASLAVYPHHQISSYSHQISCITMPSLRNTNNSHAATVSFVGMYPLYYPYVCVLMAHAWEFRYSDTFHSLCTPESFLFL